MSTSHGGSLALPLALLLWSAPAAAAEFRVGQPVMGTVLQVTVVAGDASAAKDLAEDCMREARRWDDILTVWRPEGELARLNQRAGKGPTEISQPLASAIRVMLSLSKASGGAFDPAVGAWVDWWRTPHTSAPRGKRVPPLAQAVRLDGDRATVAPGMALDPGGIGKGIAVDAMVSLLRRRGVTAAFIDFGGSSVHALGAPPETPEGWTVAVSALAEGEIHGTIALRDASLSTSRSSGPGDAAGPIVDPTTGDPVAGPRLAMVLSADAAAADAWSTALVVLGRRGVEKAAKAGLEALVEDPSGTDVTPGLAKKIVSAPAEGT